METKPSFNIADRARSLLARAGMSQVVLAEAMGFKGASSVQRFFDIDRKNTYWPYDFAARFAAQVVGRGNPPITAAEVAALTVVSRHLVPGPDYDMLRKVAAVVRQLEEDGLCQPSEALMMQIGVEFARRYGSESPANLRQAVSDILLLLSSRNQPAA